jgi:BASS family bile acid:Na+ symporter
LSLLKSIEKYFWVVCLAATLLGLFIPASGAPLRRLITLFLAGILFFTGLKLDFAAALREFRRPLLLVYVAGTCLVVLPVAIWLLARWLVPTFALGILILGAMPAGMATSSLTDIVRGNAALALVVTLVTSLACPIVAPLVIGLGTDAPLAGGAAYLGQQATYLAFILFAPLGAAYGVRRAFPGPVERCREALTGLAIVSLALLILGAMSATSAACLDLARRAPAQVVGLIVFLCGFSALRHVVGYALAPRRPPADRAALSINCAYVNNGLGIVFAAKFFAPLFGPAAMLPSILLQIPMILAILPVRWYLEWLEHKPRREREEP